MSTTVAELVAHLRADTRQFTTGMAQAASSAKAASAEVAAAQQTVARSTTTTAATAAASQGRVARSVSAVGTAASGMATSVRSAAGNVASSVSAISGNLSTAGARLRGYGTQVSQVGSGMRSMMLPMALAGGAAIALSVKFETSMSRIVGLTGTAASEVDGMRETVMRLSGETARPPEELADALYFIVSSGLEGERAMQALEQSARASTAGLGDTAVVADALTSTMNAYASTGLTAAEATDVLVGTVREGKVEASELTETIGRVLPMASEMGITFAEVGANIASMSLKGLDAAEATTALRGIMSALISPSQQANELFADIGTSAAGVRDSIASNGLLATLIDLKAAVGGNIDQLAVMFPEVRGMTGVLNLLNGNAEQASSVFRELENSTGAADAAFAAASDTAGFKLNQAMADVKAAAIELGDTLAPMLAAMASGIAAAVRWFDRLPGPVKTTLLVVAGLAAAFALLTPVVGAIITGLGGMLSVLGFLMTPVGVLIIGIAALAFGLWYAYQKVGWFHDAVQATWEWLKGPGLQIVKDVAAAIVSAWDTVVAWVRTNWPTISDIISGVGDIIRAVIDRLVDAVGNIVDAWQWVADKFSYIGSFISDLWDRFGSTWLEHVMVFVSALGDTIGGVVKIIKGIIDFVAGVFTGDWGRAWDGIKGIFAGVWDAVGGILRMAVNALSGILDAGLAWLSAIWARVWDGIKAVAGAAWDGILSLIGSYLDALTGLWSSVWRGILGVARSVWGAIVGAVRTALGWVGDALSAVGIRIKVDWSMLWNSVWGVVTQVWGFIWNTVSTAINAVWTVIRTVAGYVLAYWQFMWGAVSGVVTTVWGAIWGAVSTAINAVWTVIQTVGTYLMAYWSFMWNTVGGFVRTVWAGITSGVRTGINAVLNIVRSVMGAVRGVWDGAWSAMRGVLERAVEGFKSIFRGVVSAMATPLNFVIRNVIQKFLDGVRMVANAIPGISISVPTLPTIPTRMHSGGLVTKDGTSGRGGLRGDEVLRTLQVGEGVISAKAMKGLGGDALDIINNRRARTGGLFEDVAGAVGSLPGVGSIMDAARDLIANVARPLVERALGALDGAVGQFGMPARLVSGFARRIGEGVLNWIDSADDVAKQLGVPEWSAGMGWKAMWDSVHHQFPWATLHSGMRPGAITATGNRSYHSMGRAIDITPSMAIFDWLHDNYMPVLKELIFTPAGARQVHNGRHHVYSGITAAMHHDHIHAAAREGLAGVVSRPTLLRIGEGAGREEVGVNPLRKGGLSGFGSGRGGGAGDMFIDVTLHLHGRATRQDGKAVVDALKQYQRDNGAVPIRVTG